VEEGDPVCDLSFEGGVVTVASPARGEIKDIVRSEGQQADAAYTIGIIHLHAAQNISFEGGEALSSKEKSSKPRHALKYLFNGRWRQKLAIVLIAGVAVGAGKGVYNHFTEPSFEDLFGRDMSAELERREGLSRSESAILSESLELSDLDELADYYFGLGQRDGALKLTEYFYMLSDEDYSQGREEELWSEVGELVSYLSGLTFNELTEPVPLPSRFNNFGALRDNRGNSATASGGERALEDDASLLALYRNFYVMVNGGRQHPSWGIESFNDAGIYFDIADCEGIAPGYGRYTFSYDFSSALWETAELSGSSWRVECIGFCFFDDGGYQTRSMSFRVGSDLENFLRAALNIKDHCEDPELTRASRLR
jgi:hypothetical protein